MVTFDFHGVYRLSFPSLLLLLLPDRRTLHWTLL